MKSPLKLLSLMIPAVALTLLVSGCYTQLVTREGDEATSSGGYEQPRSYDETDTLAQQPQDYSNYVYDDSYWRPHTWIGFDFYYPSYYWWNPYYTGLMWGSPFWYPYYYGYYGYPYYGYYGYPSYGYPYSYYRGYPFVVYAGNTRTYQTRESGYRRSGVDRVGGYYGTSGTPSGSISVPPASRRSGSSSVAPLRKTEPSPGRAPARGYVPRSSGRSPEAAPAGRSSAPSVRSAPSRGSSGGASGGGNRSSGRSRSYYEVPPTGSYRNAEPGYRGYTPPARGSTPSYSPSPARSSAPSSPAPSSGGSSGGSRSSGASRSGHR